MSDKKQKYTVCVIGKEDLAPEFQDGLDYVFKKHGRKAAEKVLDKMGAAFIRLAEVENADALKDKTFHAETQEEAERLANDCMQAEKDRIINKHIDEQTDDLVDNLKKADGEKSDIQKMVDRLMSEKLDGKIKEAVESGELSEGAGEAWEDFRRDELGIKEETTH